MAAGADGVELDVRRSRDGAAVVIHDESLQRTMGIRRRIDTAAWAAIERLSAARVPSLEQATAWAVACGAWLNVEIKSPNVEERVVSSLAAASLRERAFVSSFSAEIVRRVGEVGPDYRRFLLTEEWNERVRDSVETIGAGGVCLRVDAATDAALDDLSQAGFPVVVWTVNEAGTVRRLLEYRVAAIITDFPELAARVRAGLSS
jgi:glycerophosphoryl diester phosphodiesterase